MAEAKIKEFRAARGIAKRQLTLIEKFINEMNPTTDVYVVEARFESLSSIKNHFEEVQMELERIDPSEIVEPEDGQLTEREDFENRFIQVKAKLQRFLKEAPEVTVNFNPSHNSTVVDFAADLPHIELPEFHGDYAEFPTFCDLFETLVHQNQSKALTNVRRMSILLNACKGRAYDSIKHLKLCNENYEIARAILFERFSNPRLIYEENVKGLWDAPRATSAKSLRDLADAVHSRLKALERVASHEEVLSGVLVHLVLDKADSKTKLKWEENQACSKEIPTFCQFFKFLQDRCTVWEAMDASRPPARPSEPSTSSNVRRNYATQSRNGSCLCANDCEQIVDCADFKKLDPRQKFYHARNYGLCFNCLLPMHDRPCMAPNCGFCNRPHHTLLHCGKRNNGNYSNSRAESSNVSSFENMATRIVATGERNLAVKNKQMSIDFGRNYCFLATAIILVKNSLGHYVPLRVLLDGAAQISCITADAANLLGLRHLQTHVEISGVNGSRKVLKKAVKLQFKSAVSDFCGEISLPINPHFQAIHPAKTVNIDEWKIPKNIRIADPNFQVTNRIDILLDAHTTYELQAVGQIKLGDGLPILQKTLLGWIVVGNYDISKRNKDTHSINFNLSAPLDELINRFWAIEDAESRKSAKPSPEEISCEKHYVDNVRRKPDGRFVVRLPFKKNPAALGSSFSVAKHRLQSIQRKLSKDPVIAEQYFAFLREYEELGHCRRVDAVNENGYYIPHFHVLNPASTTTALRVVFDASAPAITGLSLNDLLMVGPTIQRELFEHHIAFRQNPIALTGDISKMYRQLEVALEDQKWQRILWYDEFQQLAAFELTTVTYGTAPASFLATRVLKQLADEETDFLIGAQAIRDNMYVDDLLSGAASVEGAIELFHQVSAVLSKGMLPIRKFCSNSAQVMDAIPSELHGINVQMGDKDVVKALGVFWVPRPDILTYDYKDGNKPLTKRGIISEVSTIFDPIGGISPVTVIGKILIQRLWVLKVDWDESLPQSELTSWLKLKADFENIKKIAIPRYIFGQGKIVKVSLHIFGDASKLAYGTVSYIRSEDECQNVTIRLLASKTRVAPLKTVSLPRLELLGGLLSAHLYQKVKPLFKVSMETYFWLDATIALAWIKSSPHRWTSFVATRVTKIQEMTESCQWKHVKSAENPADIASRGMSPSKLAESKLWFSGPDFLQLPEKEWPNRFVQPKEIPEMAPVKEILNVVSEETDLVTQVKYQSYSPLKVVFGYVCLFIKNLKEKHHKNKNAPPSSIIRRQTLVCKSKPSDTGCQRKGEYPYSSYKVMDTRSLPSQVQSRPTLTAEQLEAGLLTVVKIIQRHQLPDVFQALEANRPLSKKRKSIADLHPFIRSDGLICVGGRLAHAKDLQSHSRTPILLPEHRFTKTLFIHVHHELMHAGPRAMMGTVYEKFWPLKGKVVANSVFTRCLRCKWIRPTAASQIMGSLPNCRVRMGDRAFLCTGVDYFEPLWVAQPGRGRQPLRAYGVIFVCMATKAVWLDVVDDLSTSGFLQAFSKFIARRGLPSEMFSDNGRNFVGARNQLMEAQKRYANDDHWQAVYEWCKSKGVVWHFSPPRTPHHGGLWEAAVKSAKYHLIRAIGQTSLRRSELETLLANVEAILNSRPLVPVTPHPDDGSPLTPGHFLIGEPIKSLPEPYLVDYSLSSLDRFKRLTAIKQHFWKRWSKEYRCTLMNRYKWTAERKNLKMGDYVLLVDKNQKPLVWNWGKVVSVVTAKDGFVRSVVVKTTKGVYERGITEVCPLPFDGPNASDMTPSES